ncbi:cysteine hydrolase family protein [Rubrivivax gelatinosus]|uniref:cysteine hydrolase family protein n=1 Tax=Rubrivivax gelatinosus TaxID=28068 RepID=UPI001903DD4B|nr:cysteine hydrolase family protein [Rubrivivax gelatinosus]
MERVMRSSGATDPELTGDFVSTKRKWNDGPTLLVIDVQIGLNSPEYGPRGNPSCLSNVAGLLQAWRGRRLPVIFTRHVSSRPDSPLAPGAPGLAIEAAVAPHPGEPVFDKRTNSPFKLPAFVQALAPPGPHHELVIVGLATDACVTAAAREAKDLGYEVTVVHDACASFDRPSLGGAALPADLVHEVCIAALAASGITLRSTQAQRSALGA